VTNLDKVASALLTSSTWLQKARIQTIKLNGAAAEKEASTEVTEVVVDTSTVSGKEVVGQLIKDATDTNSEAWHKREQLATGTFSRPAKPITKETAPALQSVGVFADPSKDPSIEGHRITINNSGKEIVFDVYDATTKVDFKGLQADKI
jgi:hypothetical protein